MSRHRSRMRLDRSGPVRAFIDMMLGPGMRPKAANFQGFRVGFCFDDLSGVNAIKAVSILIKLDNNKEAGSGSYSRGF